MSHFETSLTITRPVEEVFAFVTNLDTWPKWQSDLVEVKNTSPDPLAAGSTYTVVSMARGREQEVHYTVDEFEANNKITVSSPGTFNIDIQTTFTQVNEGTQVQVRTDITSGGLRKILEPLGERWFKEQTESSYGVLKGLLEEPAG